MKRAKLSTDISPHTMRHTTLSRLVAKGVDVRTLQEIGGHATLAALARYLHTSKAAEAVSLLDDHPSQAGNGETKEGREDPQTVPS